MHKQQKTAWQKIWHFIWDDDSIWSWIANIIIAFVLIKFVIYPGLGFVFGTSHPVVAVVSGSMEHKITTDNLGRLGMCGKYFEEKKRVTFDFFWEHCGEFYNGYNINKLMFEKFSFKNGFNTGDIIVLFGKNPERINIGDVIVFKANKPDPIIHRVIKKWESGGTTYFQTKGDHNADSLNIYDLNELEINEGRVIGKAVFRIPFLGYIKIGFVQLLQLLNLNTTLGRLF